MRHHSEPRPLLSATPLSIAVALCLFFNAAHVSAQSVGATLRGQVISGTAAAGGAQITATNTLTGFARSVQADTNGNYHLAGLPPGTYKVDVKSSQGDTSQAVALQVGQTATLDLDVSGVVAPATTTESVIVVATKLFETRTSEIASYVSARQIEALPQSSRNFLAFADTIPGVQFVTTGDGASSELRSGAQAANGVNVFIDGVGQKNYVLRGGVSGQTNSRGNPFPQLAIGEYKVITSNYKAEFDQLSSAAVVAATRSGTNEFESEVFWDHTAENWRASDPLEARAGRKSPSEQEQYGIAFGGPIIQDRMHFFAAYEGKEYETPKTVTLGQGFPVARVGDFAKYLGPVSAPFDEDLFFGKIDFAAGDDHLIELTTKVREESEISNIGDERTATFGETKDNEETRVDLRYQYSAAQYLNDLHLTYEDATYNPRPVTIAPGYRLTDGDQTRVILSLGGGENFQEKGQKGWAIQDDLTFTALEWHGTHTIKAGIKYKLIDIAAMEQQPYNQQFYYDINNDLTIPFRVRFGAPLSNVPDPSVTSENKQLGIYIQDDWEVTDKLLLNVGVRWDYEETPSYLDYVTPADVVAGLNAIDPAAVAAGRPNQTYAQTLALGGIDINDYISTGNNRDAFSDAIQPRIGFSYDVAGDERIVIFGGAGRAYDRNVFDYIARERTKGTFPSYEFAINAPGRDCSGQANCLTWDPAYLQDPGLLQALIAADPNRAREVNLINNNLKTPYSDQYSVGVRNRWNLWNQDWLTSAAVSYIESKDGIVFLLGNRYPDGSFRQNPDWTWGGQPWNNEIPGLGTLIIGKNGLATRAKSVLLQAEKPYTQESGWSATFAYTYTDAKENRTNIASVDETYIFDYPDVSGFGWHASTGVSKHRFVASAIWDAPWETVLSAKLTLASPLAFQAENCVDATVTADGHANCFFQNFKDDTTFGLRQLDLALQKNWLTWNKLRLRLRADVLNVFNYDNIERYELGRGSVGSPNPAFGTVTAYRQPTRTFKLSFGFDW